MKAARTHDFPLFEVPYELPFIAITERAFAQPARRALRNAAAQHGRRRARRGAHRAPVPGGRAGAAAPVRDRLARGRARLPPTRPGAGGGDASNGSSSAKGSRSLVAIRDGLLCAVVDAPIPSAETRSRRWSSRARCARSSRRASASVRAAASRSVPTQSLRMSFHEARCALEAVRLRNGDAPEVASLRGSRRLPAAAVAAGRRGAQLLLPQRARSARRRARATTAKNWCARWTSSSSTTATGRRPPARSTATATRCATGSAAIEQLTGRDLSNARDRIEFWLALRGRELAQVRIGVPDRDQDATSTAWRSRRRACAS